MTQNTLYQTTLKRLQQYGVFSDATAKTVAEVAEQQSKHTTYKTLFTAIGMPGPQLFVTTEGKGASIIDVPAQTPSLTKRPVLVMHLPMANPLDPNQLFQIATVAMANPEYRIIGFGNPSAKPYLYREQNLKFIDRVKIAFGKDKGALVKAELEYLDTQNIESVFHIGYSYGAHKALLATEYARSASVQGVAVIDPVAHPRGLRQLLGDFKRTFNELGNYADRTEQEIYLNAREESSTEGSPNARFYRQINIAIGLMLARLDFIGLVKKVLSSNANIAVAVSWSVKSELGNNAHLSTVLDKLKHDTGRVVMYPLEDDYHALANDIYLHAALIRESLGFLDNTA